MGKRLSKIYTKTGDSGTTALADGARISKTNIRVKLMGAVDHLNSCIGVIRAEQIDQDIDAMLTKVQHHLFDIGGELCMPELTAINDSVLEELEESIDLMNSELQPLKEFILPGGSKVAAALHMARTQSRLVETQFVELHEQSAQRSQLLSYINRLSDWLFVAARFQLLKNGNAEILWSNPYKK